jgi:bacitracin transport system permease protein
MFPELIQIEIKKYKRTFIPWMILVGGVLPVFTAFMMMSNGIYVKSWSSFAAMGLNYVNLLALLLVAVFSGYVFVTEYHENIIGILFTYPISRLKLYVAKYIVILLMVCMLYLVFFISSIMMGFLYTGSFPQTDFLLKFVKIVFLMTIANYMLSPVTVIISIVITGIGTYILAGIGYFIVYISFINSDLGIYIPPCIPDKLVGNYMVTEYISKADFITIIIISTVTFFSTFFIGAVCYYRDENNKT